MARVISEKKKETADSRRVEDRVERQRTNFDALVRLIEGFGTTFDLNVIVSLFLATFVEQLKVKSGALFLIAPERRRFEPCRSIGISGDKALAPIPLESGFVRWLREANGSVRVDEFFVDAAGADGEEEEMPRSLVDAGFSYAIALEEAGNPVGMLLYGGAAAGKAFSEADDELVRMLVRVASAAIKNAFLHRSVVMSKLELERFSEVKRTFIDRTSRELRTSLTVLTSALWSLEPDQVDESVLVDMARDAATRLQGKLESLLSLNEIELNTSDFKLESSEISSIIEDVLREILPELEEKQIQVSVDDQARYRKVLIDPGKIAIVIRSILDNAVNFVGRGGNIAIAIRIAESRPGSEGGIEIGDWRARSGEGFDARLVPLAHEGADNAAGGDLRENRRRRVPASDSYLVIAVKDDGIGMRPDEIRTLAEPFAAASNSTNGNVRGCGIGLSVSQKIVEGHGGTMFCESDLGQGAQFSVWLPLDA